MLDPKPPKAGFCPNSGELPNADDELPNVGVDEVPSAGVVLPKAGEDAPKVWVEPKGEEDCVAPKTPVELPAKRELPVLEPKGVVPPKGLGANGLLPVCPKADCEPNGLVGNCPKGLVDPNIVPLESNPTVIGSNAKIH